MKKLLPWLFFSLLLGACSDSPSSPDIRITNFYVNGDEKVDYAKDMESLPPLHVNDEVTMSLNLDGNGEELNTFLVHEDMEEGSATSVKIAFLDLADAQLSQDKEFTDKEQGKLGFIDGVSRMNFKITAKVFRVTNDKVLLKLYLFSKPVDCEGAKLELELNLGKE